MCTWVYFILSSAFRMGRRFRVMDQLFDKDRDVKLHLVLINAFVTAGVCSRLDAPIRGRAFVSCYYDSFYSAHGLCASRSEFIERSAALWIALTKFANSCSKRRNQTYDTYSLRLLAKCPGYMARRMHGTKFGVSAAIATIRIQLQHSKSFSSTPFIP
jgi:hypothetical protein